MEDNINNIPENETEENITKEEKNYIDFVVEDDVLDIPEKKFSVPKLLAIIFGIVSGLILLYYTVETFFSLKDQLSQYEQMGVVFPLGTLALQYLPVLILLIISLCPIVGGLLPRRYSKCSILLLAIPVSYVFGVFLQQTIACFVLNISMAEAYLYILITLAGILTLAAAVLSFFTGEDVYDFDDEFEYFEYDEESDVQDEEDIEIEETVEKIENDATTEEVDFPEPKEEAEEK